MKSLNTSRWINGLSVLGVCSLALVGCKDQQKCDEALSTARKAMQEEFLDMALARQWRERAGKICGVGDALTQLDGEIVAKEAALLEATAAQAKKEAEDGGKALEAAKTLWKEWDALEDDDKTKKSVKKTKKKSDRTIEGLTEAYAKQVLDFNTSRYDRRLDKLEDDK